jgi:hypothetical protein
MEDYLGMSGGIAGLLSLVIGIIIKLNHKRCRSNCCGKKMEVTVDVEETTPPNLRIPTVRDDAHVIVPCKT